MLLLYLAMTGPLADTEWLGHRIFGRSESLWAQEAFGELMREVCVPNCEVGRSEIGLSVILDV